MSRGQSGRNRGGEPQRLAVKDAPLRRIAAFLQPYRGHFALMLVLVLIGATLDIVPPLAMRMVIDRAIPGGNRTLLLQLVLVMVLLPATSGCLGVLQNHLNTRVGHSIMLDLRLSLFRNLQRQSIAFFTHSRAGEVVQRLTGDVAAVQETMTRSVVQAVTQIVTVLVTMAILFTLDWRLALLSLALLPLFVLPVRSVGRIRRRIRGEVLKVQSDLSVHLGEVFGVSGALLTKIFGREPHQEKRFTGLNERLLNLEIRANLVGRWFGVLTALLGPLGAALIYLYGGFSAIGGHMTVGEIVAFAAYLGRLYGPVAGLLNLHVDVTTALAIFQRIFEYQDLVPEVRDAPDASPLPPVTGRIAFEGVSFAYREGSEALTSIAITAEPDSVVALVGPSGAGKSTLIGLVARLYDPTAGSVTIDGHDLRGVTLASLQQNIAVVTQDPFLFHATVKENLLFAKEDASDADLEEACRQALIHDLIMSLPQQYETVVGERGYLLSGGERQRLAIARAILKNPRILILDEATSHLDTRSEAYVQAALEELMRGRTTLVIAHRLSTVLAADKIVVLDRGQVVEEGTHGDLLVRGGLYARLFTTQFAPGETRTFAHESELLQG